ncbi:MAG TPA: hypothetical protein VI319_07925 [Burkholderiales bacterium]
MQPKKQPQEQQPKEKQRQPQEKPRPIERDETDALGVKPTKTNRGDSESEVPPEGDEDAGPEEEHQR